jgi:acetyl-CoA C-acetyltransferase
LYSSPWVSVNQFFWIDYVNLPAAEASTMSTVEVVLCNPIRKPIGTFNGSLKATPATVLGAAVIRETLQRSGLAPEKVETLVMGQVIQAGSRMNTARQAGIGAGLPVDVPALTVNRVCGSGAQGIVIAAQEIWAGFARCAIAGGMENMDMAPYVLAQGRWGAGWAEIVDRLDVAMRAS